MGSRLFAFALLISQVNRWSRSAYSFPKSSSAFLIVCFSFSFIKCIAKRMAALWDSIPLYGLSSAIRKNSTPSGSSFSKILSSSSFFSSYISFTCKLRLFVSILTLFCVFKCNLRSNLFRYKMNVVILSPPVSSSVQGRR